MNLTYSSPHPRVHHTHIYHTHMFTTPTCSHHTHMFTTHMFTTPTCSTRRHDHHTYMFNTLTCSSHPHVHHTHMFITPTCSPHPHVHHIHIFTTLSSQIHTQIHTQRSHMFPDMSTKGSHISSSPALIFCHHFHICKREDSLLIIQHAFQPIRVIRIDTMSPLWCRCVYVCGVHVCVVCISV